MLAEGQVRRDHIGRDWTVDRIDGSIVTLSRTGPDQTQRTSRTFATVACWDRVPAPSSRASSGKEDS